MSVRQPRAEKALVVVTGMLREARLAEGPGVHCLTGYRDPAGLRAGLARIPGDIAALMSFGIAGALDPALRVGDVVVGVQVCDPEGRQFEADPRWTAALSRELSNARRSRIAGSDVIVADAAAKRQLRVATNAAIVDMESHCVARLAHERGLPFGVLRVVADTAQDAIPTSAQAGLNPDGSTAPLAVIRELAKRPWQLPALLVLARRTEIALASLAVCRRLLGSDLGFPGIGG